MLLRGYTIESTPFEPAVLSTPVSSPPFFAGKCEDPFAYARGGDGGDAATSKSSGVSNSSEVRYAQLMSRLIL